MKVFSMFSGVGVVKLARLISCVSVNIAEKKMKRCTVDMW